MHTSIENTVNLKSFIKNLDVDLVGIADIAKLEGMPAGFICGTDNLLQNYRYGIVLGASLGKFGKNVSGNEASLQMEKAALEVISYLEKNRCNYLIIHTEDEFDPVKRIGLLSLKVLAKAAGLGWQGRSLLIISPKFGPIHRWIAVLTNLELQADVPILNQCGTCTICIDKCPSKALKFSNFEDHPNSRDEVLNIEACRGDNGCIICLAVCPWLKHLSS